MNSRTRMSDKPHGYKYLEILFVPVQDGKIKLFNSVKNYMVKLYGDDILHTVLLDVKNNVTFGYNQDESALFPEWRIKDFEQFKHIYVKASASSPSTLLFDNHNLSDIEQKQVLQRAYAYTFEERTHQELKYDPLMQNCQTTMYRIVYNKRMSSQAFSVMQVAIHCMLNHISDKLIKMATKSTTGCEITKIRHPEDVPTDKILEHPELVLEIQNLPLPTEKMNATAVVADYILRPQTLPVETMMSDQVENPGV